MKTVYFIVPILGFIIGYSSFRTLDKNNTEGKQAYLQEDTVLSVSMETLPSPTPTPTITPSPKPTNIPTQIPTPTEIPTPTPTKIIIAPADMEPLFEEFSITFNVDKNKLKKIADCESHFNRGVWKDPYAGMYQFSETTWTKYRNLMGKDPNINLRFGARESIETAAYVLSIGAERIWPTCSK